MSKTSITGPWFKTTKDRLEEELSDLVLQL